MASIGHPEDPSSQQLPQPSQASPEIVLTTEQAERLMRLEAAMMEIRANDLTALKSLQLFAEDIQRFLNANSHQPPGVKQLLESESQRLLTSYTDELGKLLAARNSAVAQEALHPVAPQPVYAQSVIEPARKELSQAERERELRRTLGCLLKVVLIPASLFMLMVSCGLFFTNQRNGRLDGSPLAFLLIIGLIAGGWVLVRRLSED